MVRGQLPKAYLRLDPNIDQVHPDVESMVRLLCIANRQPRRGYFKSRAVLDALLGKRRAAAAISRGDVVENGVGWHVQGWEEWQEGDWTVAERQRRIRDRRNGGSVTDV